MTVSPKKCVEHLAAEDTGVLNLLGIELAGVNDASVKLEMSVAPQMVNSQSFCHGGIVFTLADTAAAYSCAALNLNPATVDAQIAYLQPARANTKITATATVLESRSKILHVEVRVTDGDDTLLARYHGTFYNRGSLIPD